MNMICLNGKFKPADKPVLQADNRSFRYGDGLFETMKLTDSRILLASLHFDRLERGIGLLGLVKPKFLDRARFEELILELARKNKVTSSARVRLSVFRGNGGILEGSDDLQYLIECWPLDPLIHEFNQNGLVLGVYPHARKSCDRFSSIKSSCFLPYSLAARFAKASQWNDAVVLNTSEAIADTTIASVFLIRDGVFITPSLEEGCVDGVMRRFLIGWLKDNQYEVLEQRVTVDDVAAADEVFLTNAIRGIRWVGSFGEDGYGNIISSEIHRESLRAHREMK